MIRKVEGVVQFDYNISDGTLGTPEMTSSFHVGSYHNVLLPEAGSWWRGRVPYGTPQRCRGLLLPFQCLSNVRQLLTEDALGVFSNQAVLQLGLDACTDLDVVDPGADAA